MTAHYQALLGDCHFIHLHVLFSQVTQTKKQNYWIYLASAVAVAARAAPQGTTTSLSRR
jgi:hypothetical protein